MNVALGRRYAGMIAILAILAYAPTLRVGFLWDDHVMIENNRWIQSWGSHALRHDFTSDVFDGQGDRYYRPLQTVFNRIDMTLWGRQPVGFHLTNMLFHLGNALLVALLVLRIGYPPLIAFLTASLFAVHPIVVEQLMIIAGRAELMALFFSLASILLLLERTPGWRRLGGLAFVLALFSKESAVITPLLLALVLYVRRAPRTAYRTVLWMVLGLLPYIALRRAIVGPIVADSNAWLTVRFFTQAFPGIVFRYLRLLIVPWELHSHRLVPHLSHFWLLYLAGALAGFYYAVQRWGRPAVFCLGWFLLGLLPKTPTMIYGNMMLDHWAYPAAIGFLLPLGLLIARGWTARQKILNHVTAGVYFSLLIAWCLLAHLNVALRGTDETMYRWALRFTSSSPIQFNLGVVLLHSGRAREAVPYFAYVRALYPEEPAHSRALALAYWLQGQRKAAIGILEDYLRHYPADKITVRQLRQFKSTSPRR